MKPEPHKKPRFGEIFQNVPRIPVKSEAESFWSDTDRNQFHVRRTGRSVSFKFLFVYSRTTMQEHFGQLLAMLFPVCVEHARQQTLGALRIEVILSAMLGIPAPFIAEKNHTIAIIEKHLRCTAGVSAVVFGVLE